MNRFVFGLVCLRRIATPLRRTTPTFEAERRTAEVFGGVSLTEFCPQTPSRIKTTKTLFISYLFLRARKENVVEAVLTTVKAKKRHAIFARLVKASLLFVPSIITTFIRSISSSGLLSTFRVIHRISAGILFQLSTLLRILCLPFYAAMPFLSLLGRA